MRLVIFAAIQQDNSKDICLNLWHLKKRFKILKIRKKLFMSSQKEVTELKIIKIILTKEN